MDYLEDNITIETLLQAEKQQATEKPKADPISLKLKMYLWHMKPRLTSKFK